MAAAKTPLPSKDMPPISSSIGRIFFQNQFRTKIAVPTRNSYSGIVGTLAIITGANTGLGFEAAKQLLSIGLNHLIMGVRSLEKGKRAASTLQASFPNATIDVWYLDMESYDSVAAFADKCQSNLPRIDFVILNAGLSPLGCSTVAATGHERALQVNYLSTVLLASLLLPILKNKGAGQASPPRLTLVNSLMAHICSFDSKTARPLFPALDKEATWTKGISGSSERYSVSKLLAQLFVVRLCSFLEAQQVTVNMVDSGLVKGTGLARDVKGPLRIVGNIFNATAGRDVSEGAATYIDALVGKGTESHGCFLMNCKITPLSRWFYDGGSELEN